MRFLSLCVFFFGVLRMFSQYAPPAGQAGSTALYYDSSIFIDWAIDCTVQRGMMDVSQPDLGFVSYGEESNGIGNAADNTVVSLGDGGQAVLYFDTPIVNGYGFDFAIFENAFNDYFLELGFVEVSTNGVDFVRFPSFSLSPVNTQIPGFGNVDATKVHNLAGKYRNGYGTPFDLEDVKDSINIDINSIQFVKIIDVIGCIDLQYCTYDSEGRIINDPWNTPFESGGFDLNAVGVINNLNSISNDDAFSSNYPAFYPNPTSDYINLTKKYAIHSIEIFDSNGNCVLSITNPSNIIYVNHLLNGIYYLRICSENECKVFSLVKK